MIGSFRYSLFFLLSLAFVQMSWSQGSYLGLTFSGGYFINSGAPGFSSSGYPSQFLIQLGPLVRVDVSKKVSLEFSPVYYKRKEKIDCIYFPDGTEPLANANPLINHPVYKCDARSNTEMQYLDIPLTVYYTIKQREKFKLLAGLGIGPQIRLSRKTVITDQLTGEVRSSGNYDSTRPFLLSWKTFRSLLAYEQNVTERLSLGGRIAFQTDKLLFSNNTVALGVYSIYKL